MKTRLFCLALCLTLLVVVLGLLVSSSVAAPRVQSDTGRSSPQISGLPAPLTAEGSKTRRSGESAVFDPLSR